MTTEKRSSRFLILYLTTAGVIAALYVVLTLPFAQFAFGPIQFRLAEIMTVLPILTPAAIPGLAIGCFLSNLLNPMNLGIIDIIFGSLATLIAALLTSWIARRARPTKTIPKDLLSLVPPVVVNAAIVGTYLPYLLSDGSEGSITLVSVLISILSVGLSELFVVYVIGFPFLQIMRRTKLWNPQNKE
jgi:uncharacterized membrane protein